MVLGDPWGSLGASLEDSWKVLEGPWVLPGRFENHCKNVGKIEVAGLPLMRFGILFGKTSVFSYMCKTHEKTRGGAGYPCVFQCMSYFADLM